MAAYLEKLNKKIQNTFVLVQLMKYSRLLREYIIGLHVVMKQSCYDKMFLLFCQSLWFVRACFSACPCVWKALGGFDVCVTVHLWHNSINNQLDATIKFISNFNQLNMFRAIISPILRSIRLC